MSNNGRKFFLYVIPILMVLAVITNVFFEKSGFRVVQTSLLALIENVSEYRTPSLPDLSIESVSLQKISEPTDDYNFYKYRATMVVQNLGGHIKDATVVASAGNNQKFSVIRTDENGFSLKKGKRHIVDSYFLILNGDYNSADFDITLELKDSADIDVSNNIISTNVFESTPRISPIKVEKVHDNGYVTFEVDVSKYNDGKHSLYLFSSDSFEANERFADYYEYYQDRVLYEYTSIRNTPSTLASSDFEKKEIEFTDPGVVKFGKNPFTDGGRHTLYFMAVDNTTGKYAISDLVVIAPPKAMNKAQFAKLFVEYAGIDLDSPFGYFKDISDDDWFAAHVDALFSLGLLDTSRVIFEPSNTISRSEVLTKVLEYFDADLALPIRDPKYKDVDVDNSFFPYVQAFSSLKDSDNMSERFKLDLDATQNFLKYLIDAYKESN